MIVGEYVYFSGLFDFPLKGEIGKVVSVSGSGAKQTASVQPCNNDAIFWSYPAVSASKSYFVTERDSGMTNFDVDNLKKLNQAGTKRPYATKTKRRTYTVTDEVHAQLRELGNGNASAGIREAVRKATAETGQGDL